ncbi:hypothetical protein DL546_007460 [Coniochaeta pulveracea]|uniref:DNA-directed RNA polymerase III subunit rpc5 n=1 Tax=Coniochaeta pulveracea TaxID=177199 RepID=A0A420YI46_9PEZI|nr:hypothetical protein DL546_007460 [Coniochaeta pulveracea]
MANSVPLSVEDDDPIIHTYSVFIKPPLPAQRKLLVLQHPNTQSDYPDTLQAPPFTDLRLKTGSGMVEADVPLDYNTAYDRHKGIVWGTALQKSAAAKTSLGLSGGFGVGGAPARTRGRGAAGDEVEGGDFNEAVRTDRVLRKQTLGGLSTEPKDARYLVAVFQGKNVHLTPVSSLAHLRPQLHHIDAAADQERIARATSSSAAGAKEPGTAKAIHMTIKSSTGDEVVTETMADRLRSVQLEPWKKMEFVEEDAADTWDIYSQTLLMKTEDNQIPDVEGKGKGKELAADEAVGVQVGNAGADALNELVPGLGTDWGEDELLRAVSGIGKNDKKPGEEAVTEPEKKLQTQKKLGPVVKPETTSPTRTRTARARKPGPAATRRGGKAAGPSNAMDVDGA